MQVEPPQKIDPSCKANLKALNRRITDLTIGIFKAFGKPSHTELEIADMVNELKMLSNSFMESCRAMRINEAYLKLMEKRKRDTEETNALSDRMEEMLKELDQRFSLTSNIPAILREDNVI